MHSFKHYARFRQTLAGVLTVSLVACGGGSDGGNQDPDPVAVDLPIAFVKRPIPVDANGARTADNALDPSAFNPGAALILKDRVAASAAEHTISAGAFTDGELYDVKDLASSDDGDKIIFSMHAPNIEGLNDDQQPKWNIWEYELSTDTLRRIISSDISAEAGQDLSPRYLPDGRIVFSSTRQRRSRAILLDESKPQFSALEEDRNTEAFLLHVMDADGTNITQITFNQSHDLNPTVLSSGEILFTRWDNAANRNSLSLYTVEPDGHKLTMRYGYHSQNTGTNNSEAVFLRPQEMPDGRILVSLRPRVSDNLGGDMVAVDSVNYTEIDQPTAANGGATAPGQQSLAVAAVSTDNTPSPHGHFSSVNPLYDGTNRLLVSWSLCSLIDTNTQRTLPCTDENLALTNIQAAPPLYGLWIYDLNDATQRPIVRAENGIMYTDVITLEPKTAATFIPPKTPVPGSQLNDGTNDGNEVDEDLFNAGVGVVHIRSIYDFAGIDTTASGIAAMADPSQTTAAQRPARFVRIVKSVSMPDRDVRDFDNSAFGRSTQQLMREIIGYVPIEPDGSVKFKVPADIPFAISVLDANGRRVNGFGRHQNWLQVLPGEQRQCNGCHTAASELPHGRMGAEAASANSGASATGVPFPNTNPALFADLGETMAEVYARIRGIREPTVDMVFFDDWVDPAVTDPTLTAFSYSYADLSTPAPASIQCQTSWNVQCRTVVHYPVHIQPIWELERPVVDGLGNVIGNNKCTNCHNTRDAMAQLQVPAGQLDLTGAASADNADHLISYRELLFNDFEQELVGGVLVDREEQATDANGNPIFQMDANGNLILDNNGNPIPVLIRFTVRPSMRTTGATASNTFFAPTVVTVDHSGFLTAAEQKLISEWLDVGAQYYNNPFDAPLN